MILFSDLEGWTVANEEALLDWLQEEARREELEGPVNLVLVGDEDIARMNAAWLGHEGPTDVIAFRLDEEPDEGEDEGFVEPGGDEDDSPGEPFPVGEVYVSLERAAVQAREYACTVTEEVSRLLVHGVLHLAGWRDDDDEKRRRMAEREDEALTRARGDGGTMPWKVTGPAKQEA